MKKAFKSKIGFLLISILLILVSAEAYMIYTTTIAGIIAVGVLIIFFVYMYMDTLYVLTSDKKLKIFFISESIMRTKTWDEICTYQLYKNKTVMTVDELEKAKWIITYNAK